LLFVAASFVFSPVSLSNNVIRRELSANGVWSLFAAFRHNQLDYRQFYPTMDKQAALAALRSELIEPGATFFSDKPLEWRRHIKAQGPERQLNVIQIVVESLGSVSLGERTPFLNAIAERSLRFTHMMATGTRTVRGIEALTLSLPPAPGASIVRRPDNTELFNVGSVFRQRGYDQAFIYGGYGYFDNMNAFFSGNGFRIVDRAVIPDENKTFGNTWGVCDEDLLHTALREADASHAQGKPFYQFVLTTSNHRPFTYPDGKIDVPSGRSRSGAIKYTDYAIGQFLREAEKHPWFRDTIFVIVADHTAGSAGKTDIPPEQYAIPCLVYSPAHIEAQSVATLCSQIDVAPTLFALLGWSYDSGFFGKNIL
ncbi:MAG: LTA synthase family protein, partial [Bilophila sp.]